MSRPLPPYKKNARKLRKKKNQQRRRASHAKAIPPDGGRGASERSVCVQELEESECPNPSSPVGRGTQKTSTGRRGNCKEHPSLGETGSASADVNLDQINHAECNQTPVCSRQECKHQTVMYRSTTAVAISRQAHTARADFNSFSLRELSAVDFACVSSEEQQLNNCFRDLWCHRRLSLEVRIKIFAGGLAQVQSTVRPHVMAICRPANIVKMSLDFFLKSIDTRDQHKAPHFREISCWVSSLAA